MSRLRLYAISILVILTWIGWSQWPSDQLTMVVCDVGQGDGIVIMQGEIQVVVDGGPSRSKMLECLRKHVPDWDRTIELVIMTNSDADHISGLIDIVSRYEVVQFISGDGIAPTQTMQALLDVLTESGVAVSGVEQGDVIKVGELMVFRVLWPDELSYDVAAVFSMDSQDLSQVLGTNTDDLNERSLVLQLEWGGEKILLTGDIGFQTEEVLVAQGILDDVDVLKVGHHGSKYSSSATFLSVIRPELAVVSVGKNSYGHPTDDVLARLRDVGARIYRTDEDGAVVLRFKE